jgi:hypothetical protein
MALGIVALILTVAVVASVVASTKEKQSGEAQTKVPQGLESVSSWIIQLSATTTEDRERGARELFKLGRRTADGASKVWSSNAELLGLFLKESAHQESGMMRTTIGVAVTPETFARIRAANGSPPLADVPPDQDAQEFELHFTNGVRLDILTTKQPGGTGAIAKFLSKFGEGIQQVEYEVSNVDRATQILAQKFSAKAIYPATRPGADGARVNFFLAQSDEGKKILIELVESAAHKT